MKKINCPLCHALNVITFHETEQVTNVHPTHHSLGAVHIGNYTMGFEGGRYDWSHAEVCPKLERAFDKESLLESYVFDQPEIMRADMFSFEDYQSAFKELGIELSMEIIRKEEGWKYICSLNSLIVPSKDKYNKAFANNPDKAFSLMKHRLLCGELIKVTNPPFQKIGNEGLQFRIV